MKKSKMIVKNIGRMTLVMLLLFSLCACSMSGSSSKPSKIGEVSQADASGTDLQTEEGLPAESGAAAPKETKSAENTPAKTTAAPEKDKYQVGDIIEVKGLKMVYTASGEYKTDNRYMQPAEGKKYIFAEFYIENTGNSSTSVSYFDFDGYADGYAVDQKYSFEKELSGSISKGRWNIGRIYFEVPQDAKEIEIEYEYNILSDKKIVFTYEGEKDCGFVPEPKTAQSEGVFLPGDIIEADKFKIAYLGCDYFTSDNMFLQPDEGNVYIYLEFEFENISSGDRNVNSLYLNCYADGKPCNSTSLRDDDLSATLSAGRKAKGTVAFQVPQDATTIEVEFVDNLFSNDAIIFLFQK